MLNTLDINLKTDIKTDRPTALGIKLMSQDKNNNQFILHFTNGGEPVTLDDTYSVEILTKFSNSGASRLTSATVRQDYATWQFDTEYITQDEMVCNYVYVRKAGSLVVSADANAFYFDVGLSEIDKDAGRVAEVYDENYQKHLDEFKDNVDFEEIAQAEQERQDNEVVRQANEVLREENYNQKVDTAIVEADVVAKVDSKVTELAPQISDLTAQLAQTEREKLNRGENESISMAMLSPEIKQSINDGVWEVNINTSDIEGGAVGFTEVATNNFDFSIFGEHLLSDETIQLYDASKVTPNSVFSGLTSTITSVAGWEISNYIPVPKGAELIATVNGNNLFNHRTEYAPRKLAVFESNYKHVSTTALSSLDNFIADNNCFVRFVYASGEVISATTTKSKKLKASSVEYFEAPKNEAYFSKEPIEFYDVNKVTNEGYSQRTGNIVEASGFNLTLYIMVEARKVVNIKINGIDRKSSPISDSSSAKIGVYNTIGEWEETIWFPDIKNQDLVFNAPKKIRAQFPVGYDDISITIDGVNKIAPEAIDLKVTGADNKNDGYNVFVFMGQSNMAGRGIQTSEYPEFAPDVSDVAYEYRAITNPNNLVPLQEPFGRNENVDGAINDRSMKTGSMVASFAKKYYELTNNRMIGISASEGGTSILQWQPGTPRLNDAINRINTFKNYASQNDIPVNGIHMVWCQGEGDGSMTAETYEGHFMSMVSALEDEGIENTFIVRIGHTEGNPESYAGTIKAQTEMPKKHKNIILVGTMLGELSQSGYLKDQVHFVQAGYNIQGEQAGTNVAYYFNNGKEPMIYDSEYDILYFSETSY